MSRLTRALLVGLALVLLLVPVMAIAADPPAPPSQVIPAIPLVPSRPSGAESYSGIPPKYEDEHYSPYAYTLDGKAQIDKIGYQIFFFGMNFLMVSKAWLLKLSIRIAEYALWKDFLGPFLNQATGVLAALRRLLWDGASPMVAGALSLSGFWAIVLYMRGRISRVWASLGGTVLIVMVTAVLLAEGPGWASAANATARGLSYEVYAQANNVGSNPSGRGLITRSGEALWDTLVYQPWLAAEFGADSGVNNYGQLNDSSFLKPDHQSYEYRAHLCMPAGVPTADCPMWADEYMAPRMIIAAWTFLATVAISGTVAVLSGGIILAQLALLFLIALAPVWLLIALWWPEQGQRLLSALWMRALGALVMQSVLAATLGVLMLLTLTVTSVFTDGWMLQSLVLTALGVVAFRYRTAWLEPLAAVSRRAGEVSARVRADPGRPSASRHTVTVAESQPAAVPPAPAFATFSMLGRAEPNPAAPEREERPAVAAAVQQVRVVSSAPAPHLAMFRSEMQVLREQMTLAENVTLREQMDQSGTGPGDATWRSLRGAAPDSAPVSLSRRATRQSAAGRERGSGLERIPKQRPRP